MSDNCTDDADLIIRVTSIDDNQDNCYRVIVITFEAEDECGNIAGGFQCYIFHDTTPPVWNFNCEGVFEYEQCPEDVVIGLQVGSELSVLNTWFIGGNEIPNLAGCVSDNCTDDAGPYHPRDLY